MEWDRKGGGRDPLGAFYRGALRTLLGVGRIRNEIVYILSGRFLLQVSVAKAMWRFERSLREGDRLVGTVARWT